MIEATIATADPWADLLAHSEWDEPLLDARRVARWPEAALFEFLRLGLLREAIPATALACAGCPDALLRDVVWIEHPITGERQAYVTCPDCGPRAIAADELRRWSIDWLQLVEFVRGGLQVQGASLELIPNRLWQLGKAYWSGRPVTLFLGRALHRRDAADGLARIAHFTSALVLVPRRPPQTGCTHPVLTLDLVCGWKDDTLAFDTAFAAVQRPAPASDSKPQRPKKQGNRAAIRQRLRTELEAHVIAARDHVQAAVDFGQEPTPLPFPTQEELAQRCGTSKATINRCLQADRELQALVKVSQDVYALLGPRGRRG